MSKAPRKAGDPADPRRARRIVPVAAAGLFFALGIMLLLQGLWIPIKAQAAQVLLAHAWTQTLRQQGSNHVRPWPWADMAPLAELRLPGGVMVVLSGGSGQALAFGPSHLPNTPLPGEPGLSVIAGHRDTHFAALARLAPGDVVVVQRADGRRHRFRIRQGRVLDARTDRLAVGGGPPRLALVTCWPLDGRVPGGPWRLVLIGEKLTRRPPLDTKSS